MTVDKEKEVTDTVEQEEAEQQPTEVIEEPEQPAVEVDKPEEPAQPEAEVQVDSADKELIEQLKQKVAELEQQAATATNELTSTKDTAKSAKEKAEAYEAALAKVVEEKKAVIPENVLQLMPESMSTTNQLDWLEKAASVVPQKQEDPAEKPAVIDSIGKPTPVAEAPELDTSKLTPYQKMTAALGELFNKE